MKKLLLLILPILLCIFTVNINVKADSDSDGWYTPDLQEYTFNIPRDSDDFIFISYTFDTGIFTGFLNRGNDFGVSQNSNGELDFTNIQQTLLWVASQSVPITGGGGGGGKRGLIPLILDSLPNYLTYNIYNTLDRPDYKGAVDRHVITYRLDFLGNYSMLLNEYIYDIVYNMEIRYELMIDYFDEINKYEITRGYTIHWYDAKAMKENKLYISMDSNLLQFQLLNKVYEDGYNAGYEQAISEGFKMTDKHILLITLIMYLITIFIYFKFDIKWILFATVLLWFVPIFLIDNLFIRIFSVIMIIATIVITFFSDREEDYIE